MQTCFNIYFNPIYIYIKKSINLAFENDNNLFYFSVSIATIIEFLNEIFKINFFGVSNWLIIIIISTILIDAYFGIKKSLKESLIAKKKSELLEDGPEKRKQIKIQKLKEFKISKLQFTFFKILTLLGYLYVVKNILSHDDNETVLSEILGFSTAVLLKVPLTIFWYYDFKSIGNNIEFLLDKKPPIFLIIEKIFEPKIKNFFNKE